VNKIVGTSAAQGARAVLCRMVFGKDAVEFASVDLHSWAVDEQGTYVAYIYDEELEEPVTLEWMRFSYGGEAAISRILETKATNLSDADMSAMEKIVRRRQAKLDGIMASDGAALYHARVKAMHESTHLAA
jgi:hypothetical protein